MTQKILEHIFESDSVEEIPEDMEMGFSRPIPPMNISESEDPQEIFLILWQANLGTGPIFVSSTVYQHG